MSQKLYCKYCDNGSFVDCVPDLQSECKCRGASNCASCIVQEKDCETCLTGFKKDEGYEKFEMLCLISDGEQNNLSGGAGIVIGCLVVLRGVGGGLAYYFIKKNKK